MNIVLQWSLCATVLCPEERGRAGQQLALKQESWNTELGGCWSSVIPSLSKLWAETISASTPGAGASNMGLFCPKCDWNCVQGFCQEWEAAPDIICSHQMGQLLSAALNLSSLLVQMQVQKMSEDSTPTCSLSCNRGNTNTTYFLLEQIGPLSYLAVADLRVIVSSKCWNI